MTCDQYSDSIGGLIDGTLEPEGRRALDEHLKSCAACRALVADFRRIHREAAGLPRMTPPGTLWMKVRARLEAQIHTEAAGQRTETAGLPSTALPSTTLRAGGPGKASATTDETERPVARAFRPAWIGAVLAGLATAAAGLKTRPTFGYRLAAFASAIVLILAVATGLFILRYPASRQAAGQPPAAQPGATSNAQATDIVQSVEMELRLAEQHYEKAIAGLEQIAKADEGSLDPQVASVLQKNLGIIDQAIRESRVALQSQPTSQVAQATLFEAFRRKVALLQDTITLINEMRKGDQAGAARVLQNINKS